MAAPSTRTRAFAVYVRVYGERLATWDHYDDDADKNTASTWLVMDLSHY